LMAVPGLENFILLLNPFVVGEPDAQNEIFKT
jgi:hypothetical protein